MSAKQTPSLSTRERTSSEVDERVLRLIILTRTLSSVVTAATCAKYFVSSRLRERSKQVDPRAAPSQRCRLGYPPRPRCDGILRNECGIRFSGRLHGCFRYYMRRCIFYLLMLAQQNFPLPDSESQRASSSAAPDRSAWSGHAADTVSNRENRSTISRDAPTIHVCK